MNNLKERTQQAVASNPPRCHQTAPRPVDIVRLSEEAEILGRMVRIGWTNTAGFYEPRKGKVLDTYTYEVDGATHIWLFVQVVGRAMPMWIFEDCFAGFESQFVGIA